ncbi:uncharacterized protein N7484_006723 [Penicillium longicatenatum]|uniref:uncharacterized protein n=1 Tax=Penicillium longicatenatum TaxID=1561947 RepID=UPI002548E79A|nr:uncharacterized protein N7484_006723 [Penicillium longicatenatum]KAJ5644216.1 hypothetical protein N7484_006723 [Penicillium longicatenatum]
MTGMKTQSSEAYLRETKQPLILGISGFFIAIETIAVALRLVSKRIGGLRIGWDDALVCLGLIFCIGDAACTIADVYHGGIGLHEERVLQIDPTMMVTWGKFIIIIPIVYFSTVMPPKLAILHLYLSIFTNKKLRYICFATAAVVVGNWIAVTIAGGLACQPISYFWTGEGNCIDINSYLRWGGFANILTDLVMLVLPIPVVWNLHASTRLKTGILITFLLGSLGLISSIVRFVEFYITNAEVDKTWAASTLVIWAVIEGGIYLVAACLPTYRPLMRSVSRKIRGSEPAGTDSTIFGGSSRPDARDIKPISSGFGKLDDEEDAVRLVTLGQHRQDIAPGAILVDHQFSVH